MKTLYLDCFSGISGDMCLGALIDAGADSGWLERELRRLPLQGWSMEVCRANSRGVTATRVNIKVDEEHQPHRNFSQIKSILEDSEIPERPRLNAIKIFDRLARAEGRVHGVPADQVHFHEVGAVDSIIDITGTALALHFLNVEKVVCSPLPPGSGYVSCRHGLLPVPAPATAELLRGIPLRSLDVEGELTTPTGAAIASTLSSQFGPLPALTVAAVGYGLGSKDFGIPNFLRVFLGYPETRGTSRGGDTILLMETNIDDMNPQLLGHIMERLLAAGALDVYFTPVYMKKNRPGVLLTVLCQPPLKEVLSGILFAETTTLGLRFRLESRLVLDRRMGEIITPYGRVRTKAALDGSGKVLRSSPEYEDCKKIALEKGLPLREVYTAALCAAMKEDNATEGAEDIEKL